MQQQYSAKLKRHTNELTEARTANMGLVKVVVQGLIEHLCFVLTIFAKPRTVSGNPMSTVPTLNRQT